MRLSLSTSKKLFVTGATLGPIVDSLHNQLLLKYDVLPISLSLPSSLLSSFSSFASSEEITSGINTAPPPFFCSSFIIPPLLGITYVILGSVIPRLIDDFLPLNNSNIVTNPSSSSSSASYRNKAILAVASTAFIIRLSEYLLTFQTTSTSSNLITLPLVSLLQWFILDQTYASLITGILTAICG